MRQAFKDQYYRKIVPAVRPFEMSRKIRLCWAMIIAGIFAVGGTLCLVLCLTQQKDLEPLKAAIFVYSMAYVVWLLFKKSFENKIKKKIMPIFCQCFGNLKWSYDSYDNGLDFVLAGLVPHFSSEEYDDIFCGSYHGVDLEIVEPEYSTGSGKSHRTVFDGVIIKLKMNKAFKTHTVIRPDTWLNISPVSGLHHTSLEDTAFNKKFDVYTDNEVEARYLLTPTFMERLKYMAVAFKAGTASAAFYRRHLMIALPTKQDLFSICSLVKEIDDRAQYVQMYKEMESIVRLIDYFKLNQNLGL